MFAFFKKLNGLHKRLNLIEECKRLKKAKKFLPKNYRSLIFFNPAIYEDFVQLLCFVDNKKNTTLVDIGANVGNFSKDFIKFFPYLEKIYLFEPQKKLNLKIKNNLGNFTNYVIFNEGIGDKDEKKIFKYEQKKTSLGSFLEYEKNPRSFYSNSNKISEEINITKLDNYMHLIKNKSQVVIKIDVQGYEHNVIKGGLEFISLADVLIIECSFVKEYKDTEPSFMNCGELLKKIDFYPIIFQDYGQSISSYGFERDVIFVKKRLLDKIFYSNY